MKRIINRALVFIIFSMLASCISLKDIQLIQPDEKLKLDNKGMIDYSVPEYYIQKNDMLLINVSSTNPSTLGILSDFTTSGNRTFATGQNQGVWVRDDGKIELPRIGKIEVEGLTIKQAREKIQEEFYKIYTPEGTFIDVNLTGIEYTMIGEANRGVFRADKRDMTILEAFARSGGDNIYADLKNVRIIRTTPDGTKQVHVDLTKESIMNSEYYWIQNNDIIVVNPRKEKIWGVGLNPLSVVTTTMGVIGTILGVYLFFDRF
ncbi:polysaccharide biosynthesis/export family protein [Faecalibacter bovis]|uniref:Polysaccharide biosynthesis/export family protein n=1 Tax=Faecalibacter bovis TaxID=2898187 RepID=A0ABX7X9Q0_9FLAO|nr:polysaccharide biosynthesis/export family protein [Faecalibacter bovis]MBS7334504.1 polysaccharide biosynthesis/export family protein [Weeksellaceae bacterium]QTV04597.1 polysaccharide biosynthesis/export family protein [Faecalibacter bovis]